MFDLTSFRLPAKPVAALRKANTFLAPFATRRSLQLQMIRYWPEPLKVTCTWWWLDPIMGSCDVAEQNSCEMMSVSASRLGASLFPPLSFIQAILRLFHIHHSCISNSNLFFLDFCFLEKINFKKRNQKKKNPHYLQLCPVSFCSNFYFASASSSPETASPKQT